MNFRTKLIALALALTGLFFSPQSVLAITTPTVSTVSPTSGTTTGGTTITINGTQFKNIEAVLAKGSSADTYANYGRIVKLDSQGNIYMVGDFAGTVTFGSLQATSAGAKDVYLVKYNAAGQEQWLRTGGGTAEDLAWSLAIDDLDNIYISGSVRLTATFSGSQITSAGNIDMFLAKYNTNGDIQWLKRAGSTGADNAYSVDTDNDENIIVTGWFTGTVTFGALSSISSVGSQDTFTLKYNSAGVEQWVRKGGSSTGAESGRSVRADAEGNIYVAGQYNGTTTFGALTSITNSGGVDAYLIKYNSSGTEQWLKKIGSSGNDFAYSVAVAPGNNAAMYVSGYITGTVAFDSINATASGGSFDGYIAKYDKDGVIQWVRTGGGPDHDAYEYVDTDASGNVYGAGYFVESFTTGSLTADGIDGFSDAMVVKYDSSGTAQWIVNGGGGYSGSYGVTTDSSGNVYMGAQVGASPATFDSLQVTNAGNTDSALVKYSPNLVVEVDGQTCSNLTYVSSTQLTCTTPINTPGYADIEVTNPSGGSATLANAYLYQLSATAPTGSISINNGASTTAPDQIVLNLSVSDDDASTEMHISNNSDFSTGSYEVFASTKPWTLSSGSGQKTVYIRFRDASQNVSATYSDSIEVIIPGGSTSATTAGGSSDNSFCSFFKPEGAPDLFQINRDATTAKLFFTPVNADVTRYSVIYGFKDGEERYGSLSEPVTRGSNSGVQSITINHLDPKQVYSFKVVPVNECANGTWSNWLGSGKYKNKNSFFYRYWPLNR